jgi:CRISPR-associated protein Csx14
VVRGDGFQEPGTIKEDAMKRILLAVCGLTPQVVTETLYVLHQQGRMPSAVRILTTRAGKDAVNAHLLNPTDGHYCRFLSEYGIPRDSVDFSFEHVLAVRDENGREIDDIGGEDDSEAFLKACMEAAFAATRDPEAAVFFSIAGGRKTMGTCLALAAQFYARPQDRLFHVLVSPEFESSREFFYPPARSRPMQLKDAKGQPFVKESRYARVTLVPLPFVSVRDRISPAMLRTPEEPAALLLSLIREQRPTLIVDIPARKLAWKGVELDMPPALLALYGFFALRKKEAACVRDNCRDCAECYVSFQDLSSVQGRISELYDRIAAGGPASDRSETGIAALDSQNFQSYKSKIAGEIKRAFGVYESPKIEIASEGARPNVRYGIPLSRERIRVIL